MRCCITIIKTLIALLFPIFLAEADLSVTLTVDNDRGFARVDEPVASGVPIPRAESLLSVDSLRLRDGSGATVAAQFKVLGRWDASVLDTTKPIKWVEVQFAANVPANSQSSYTLSDGGSGSASSPFAIQETASQFSINTGAARFHIGKTSFNLFDQVFLDLNGNGAFDGSEQVVTSSSANGSFVVSGGREYRSPNVAPRSITLEENGALRAVVRVEGFHRDGADNLLRYVTRLFFYAGKSYVRVSHTIIEGRIQGQGNTEFPNIVTTNFTRAGLRTRLAVTGALSIRAKASATVHSVASPVTSASVEQSRVTNSSAAASFTVERNGASLESGTEARNAWVDISDTRAGVAVTSLDFYRKSPQKLHVQGDGVIEAQIPSQPYTIYQAMGFSDDVTFYFHGPGISTAGIESVMEGLAVDPLFARTSGAWNRTSGAFEELAPFPAPASHIAYDNLLDGNFNITRTFTNSRRAHGLLNWLDMPYDRFDGSPDPDQTGWGNSYYDPGASMIREYARRSDATWLKEMAFPLIKHFYTTDMYDTDDANWYQNGIGGARGVYHRGAWIGDYHYMESLWLYYYLTGDRRALERGHQAGRTYALSPNWAIDADLGFAWTGLTTRIYSQKFLNMTEAFLATGDTSIKTALDQQIPPYLTRFFTAEGFIVWGGDIGENPYLVDQGWMVTQLLHPVLYQYFLLTGNQQVRNFLVTVPARIAQYHRVSSDPSSPDYYRFYNFVRITVGSNGSFTSAPVLMGGDDYFYNSERPGLALALMRSADLAGDSIRMQDARNILERALNEEVSAIFDKPAAKFTQRLGTAVGIANRSAGDPPPPDPTPPPSNNNPSPPTTPTAPPGTNPNRPDTPDNREDPEATPNQITVWGLNSAVNRGRLSVSIGAHNLPDTFIVQVNNRRVNFRRVSDQQFSFATPLRSLGKNAKNITIQLKAGQSVLLTIRFNLRTRQWRAM
jgi:hypothetical protein